MTEINHIFAIGPNCITINVLTIIQKFSGFYNPNFLFHYKDYKDLDSTIWFIQNALKLQPKFYFDIGYLKNTTLNNTVDTVFYHFDSPESIDVRWHFGEYKKQVISSKTNAKILCDKFIEEISTINKKVKERFIKEQNEFNEFIKNNRQQPILIVRLESNVDYKQNYSTKYEQLYNALLQHFSNVFVEILLPENINKKPISKYDRLNFNYIPMNIYSFLFDWNMYKTGSIPKNIKTYMNSNLFQKYAFIKTK